MWLKVGLELFGQASFRIPGPFEAGLHGPATGAKSASYPSPSTIAGLVASIAWQRGQCGTVGDEEFDDQRACLSSLGVKNLVHGLLELDGKLFVYVNNEMFPRLDLMLDLLSRLPQDFNASDYSRYWNDFECKNGYGDCFLRATKSHRYGIALERNSKNVRTSMLYFREWVGYPRGTRILAFMEVENTSESPPSVARPIGTGGRSGEVLVSVNRGPHPATMLVMGEGEVWAVMLTTPALARYTSEDNTDIPPIVSSHDFSKKLGQILTRPTGLDCVEEARVIIVPKGEYLFEVVSPGWSSPNRVFREPHLVIPPGTLLRIKADKPCIHKLAEKGLGHHGDLGWGSIIAAATQQRYK